MYVCVITLCRTRARRPEASGAPWAPRREEFDPAGSNGRPPSVASALCIMTVELASVVEKLNGVPLDETLRCAARRDGGEAGGSKERWLPRGRATRAERARARPRLHAGALLRVLEK